MGADERAIPILEPKILHSLNMTHSNESIVLLCGKADEIYDSRSGAHGHHGGQGWPLW